MLEQLKKDLRKLSDPQKKAFLPNFFKTGPGQYGEGDKFLGVTVPLSRKVAKQYKDLSFSNLKKLLESPWHEERLVALLILVHNYETTREKKYVDFYLKERKFVNNWDLVDLSAPKILGHYLLDKKRDLLYQYAKSKNLWEKRIAIVATYTFIRHKEFDDTLKISELLLNDKHDLIHKAVGWMLREVGKKDQRVLERFLDEHYKAMPRTMLRYSIERLDENKRKHYLAR